MKRLKLLLAIMMIGMITMFMASCGTKDADSSDGTDAAAQTEAQTEQDESVQEESDPFEGSSEADNGSNAEVDKFIGNWEDQTGSSAQLSIYQARNSYYADIVWNDGQDLDDSWTMECTYNESTGELDYSNCIRTTNVSDDQGNVDGEEVYTDGTGSFSYENGTVLWYDDKEQAGEGCEFVLN
ncbi:MAG: hypothetical protein IJV66_06150 [Firmicutes bacterium]|nr:hypothetical protein [Bacillota bacterium]